MVEKGRRVLVNKKGDVGLRLDEEIGQMEGPTRIKDGDWGEPMVIKRINSPQYTNLEIQHNNEILFNEKQAFHKCV